MSYDQTPKVLVFDVNETLLDIDSLQPLFSRLFADRHTLREWFAQLVLYSQAVTLAVRYATYSQIGVGALRMLGEIHNVSVDDSDVEELKSRMRDLPAHSEVPVTLQRLREADFRLVTLTNSAPDPEGNPLERTGLNRYFECMFSVHNLRKFKPAPETYRSVGDSLGVEPAAMCMIAAHTWDTLGAKAMGCAAALVTRPGNAALPVEGVPQPDIVAADLALVADEIIKRWRS
ncbi:MAG TPA: haloacid dehalogenase type II [Terriglobales bacterium]